MFFKKEERWLSVEELKECIAFRKAIEVAGGVPCRPSNFNNNNNNNNKSIYSNIDNNWGKNKNGL